MVNAEIDKDLNQKLGTDFDVCLSNSGAAQNVGDITSGVANHVPEPRATSFECWQGAHAGHPEAP